MPSIKCSRAGHHARLNNRRHARLIDVQRPLPGDAVGRENSVAPFVGVLVLGCGLMLSIASAVILSVAFDRLLDPLTPSAGAITVFAVTSICAYAVTHRREASVRRRFEQHLAPAVVRRIVDEPNLLKLSGERRQVTALFTDIEGFTAMTHRTDTEQLLATFDEYFEGCAEIIFEHGGMIDKIVGDAIHALFNAPLDLADHPKRAVACAVALRRRFARGFANGSPPPRSRWVGPGSASKPA